MNRPLSSLPLPKEIVNALNKDGYLFVEDLKQAAYSVGQIVDYDWIEKCIRPPLTLSALDHWQAELQYDRLTTFSETLNNILDGGFQCGTITEICGAPESGKTQICFQACISVQLASKYGGLAGKALFIDTRNGFSSQRIEDMIEGCLKRYPELRNFQQNFLDNITVLSPSTAIELRAIIEKLGDYLQTCQTSLQFRLIVIDSLTLPVASVEDSSQRTVLYVKILEKLKKLASEHNIGVIIVNELYTKIDHNADINFGSSGGQQVAIRSHRKLMIARISGQKFAAKLLKSPVMPQITVPFYITSNGVADHAGDTS